MWSGDGTGAPTLVCLPCAGGSAAAFKPLAHRLPAQWRVIAVDPPGHGLNRGEAPPLTSVEAMVETYLEVLEPELRGPYFLLGHSLGGLVAFLMAHRLERTRFPPAGVLVCAVRGPGHVVRERWSELSDDELLDRIDGIGGVPDVFRDSREDFKAYLPGVRADFYALETFRGVGALPLESPLWVVAARDDAFAPPERVRDWVPLGHDAEFHLMSGGHFFIQSHADDFAAWLEDAVARRGGLPHAQ